MCLFSPFKVMPVMCLPRILPLFVLFVSLFCPSLAGADDAGVFPWEFVRAGVYRPAFDPQISLELSSMVPGRIRDLETMHPRMGKGTDDWKIVGQDFAVKGTSDQEGGRWAGLYNPFACHEVILGDVPDGAAVRWSVVNEAEQVSLQAVLTHISADRWQVAIIGKSAGKIILEKMADWKDAKDRRPVGLLVQGIGSGINVFIRPEKGAPEFVAACDTPAALDFRVVRRMQKSQIRIGVAAEGEAPVLLRGARSFLSAGVGLADLRAVTLPNGETFMENGRVFITASLRGRALPHHMQGVLSFDPGLFDLRLEGVIVFDRGDGLWRNEIASHLLYDPGKREWFGLTTGFSAYGDSDKKVPKQIWAFRTKLDPRRGFAVVPVTPTGLMGNVEDPSLFYDKAAGKWRVVFCQGSGGGYHAVTYESSSPDGDFQKIAGPVKQDSTGTQIVNVGEAQKVLFGSADRKIYIASYPDLKIEGTLQMDLPPWREGQGTRVWSDVIPLPAGYPWPAVAVMMDRENAPGIPRPNWTYGAVYFYYGLHKQ
jgi:hypothetical protein